MSRFREFSHEVESIDLDVIPRGCVTRLHLVLTHNGLGESTRLPVLVMRGSKEGPVFGLTAALHGNEINGIPVIHRLFSKLDEHHLRGTLVALPVVNLPGYHSQRRVFSDGTDLNKIMPGDPNGNVSEVYANRFCEKVVKKFDYLVDLHTASFGRVNSLYVRADMTHEQTARMAYLQRPQIILNNPPMDGTLRGFAMSQGIPSITVEIGNPHQFQNEYIKRALVGLRAVLAMVGMIPRRAMAMGSPPVLCSRSYWLYTDHGGLLEVEPRVTQIVKKNQVIARLSNVFGDLVQEFRAPQDGIVIGKSVNPVGKSGARILHLGIPADLSENAMYSRDGEVCLEAGKPGPPI